jgi:hypothetical protein
MDETAVETERDFLGRIPVACENINKSRISERCARTWCFSVMLAINSVASASWKFYELNKNNVIKIIRKDCKHNYYNTVPINPYYCNL